MNKCLQSHGFQVENLDEESKSPITVIRTDGNKAIGVLFDKSAPEVGEQVIVQISELGSRLFGVHDPKFPASPTTFAMVVAPSESPASQDLANAILDYLYETACTVKFIFT